MLIALAQCNPLIGDLQGNCARIDRFVDQARAAGAELIVFPELAVTGYPPKDLLLQPRFIDANVAAVRGLAENHRDGPAILVGFVRPSDKPIGRPLHNSIALLQHGRLAAAFDKRLLPTYDVFDEHRYFEPGSAVNVCEFSTGGGRIRIGIGICEDLWNTAMLFDRPLYHSDPVSDMARAGMDLLLSPSASPYTVNKQAFRHRLLSAHARSHRVPALFVNQVGGNDELIFDGGSCVIGADGSLVAQARAFEEDLLLFDTDGKKCPRLDRYPDPLPSIWNALVLGTRDYVDKCGFGEVVIGLSGGIDSSLVAAVAVEALGAKRVHGVAMPSRFSSDHSLRDARLLAENLGIDCRTIAIEPMHRAFEVALAPQFEGRPPDTTEENIQARVRGNLLMALSNKFGWLLLTTGNKSELAVGYCTLYGDMCGGLAVISDVPKTTVYELSRWYDARCDRPVIPDAVLTKPPSAELRPDQHDQQSLPPYDVLDAVLHHYVEEEKSGDEIAALGFDPDVVREVIRKVDRNEYKRKQMATGLKVTSRAFGVGRRMPIAARLAY